MTEARAVKREKALVEALRGLVAAVQSWDSRTGHGEPWEAQRQADSDLRGAARAALDQLGKGARS